MTEPVDEIMREMHVEKQKILDSLIEVLDVEGGLKEILKARNNDD